MRLIIGLEKKSNDHNKKKKSWVSSVLFKSSSMQAEIRGKIKHKLYESIYKIQP